jgi:hypothetical protein
VWTLQYLRQSLPSRFSSNVSGKSSIPHSSRQRPQSTTRNISMRVLSTLLSKLTASGTSLTTKQGRASTQKSHSNLQPTPIRTLSVDLRDKKSNFLIAEGVLSYTCDPTISNCVPLSLDLRFSTHSSLHLMWSVGAPSYLPTYLEPQ